MTFDFEKLLDTTGWQILTLLQENARLSFSELGQRVGLSSPAVAERVRKLEEAGIITGYHAELNLTKIGQPMLVFVRMNTEHCTYVRNLILEYPEVLECHRVTGSDSLIMKISAASVEHLEQVLDRLSPHGRITTSIVLSSPFKHKIIQRPGDHKEQE